jgi:hypothetical protein
MSGGAYKMLIEQSEWLKTLMGGLAILGVVIFFMGILSFWLSTEKREKIIILLIIFVGILLVSGTILTNVNVPDDYIGLDQDGNWYDSGDHFTLKKVELIPLKGSVPLWKEGLSLQYNLTQEQVIMLDSGSNFPDQLKTMYVYEVDENWNVQMIETSNVPEGFSASRPKLTINIEPAFFIPKMF